MTVRYELRGSVAIVTIDRPEVRNAVNVPTARALAEAFRRFDADEAALKTMLANHHVHTGSSVAAAILRDWETRRNEFVKVMPREYKAALKKLEDDHTHG